MKRAEVLALVLVCACGAAPRASTPPSGPKPIASSSALPAAPEKSALARAAEPWPPADSAAGVENTALAALLTDEWSWSLEQSPVWATRLGIHRFDDRLRDSSERAIEARRSRRSDLLARAKTLRVQTLAAKDRVTLELFVEQLETDVAGEVCDFEIWTLSPRDNPVTRYNDLPEAHPLETPEDGKNLLARYRAIPRAIDEEIANLRRGARRELFANRHSSALVVEMLRRQLAQPLEQWPLLAPTKKEHPSWPSDELASFRRELRASVENAIRAAFGRHLELLEKEILPRARGPKDEGLGALPIGKACYTARAREATTLELSPNELHALGEREIARIDKEIQGLGQKLFKARSLGEVLSRLRSDKELYFGSAEQIVQKAEAALAAAKAKVPVYFGTLPRADCIVRKIPDYEAPFTTIAYYRPPVPDGSKPGEYFVNVLDPTTRPRFEAEVLAFHESIPGHHLQIAISQELAALPAFRKHAQMTAFVEGWGLYTERLSNEMGLYSGDLDRLGMLSFDAWRAARLVVDTGIHAKGWTRERAEKYMLAHTALAENNVKNEVDRYIVWPGQALAYKTGQLEILKLRERARRELGKAFDLRAFHDAVLSEGAVTLPVLQRQIEAWLRARTTAT